MIGKDVLHLLLQIADPALWSTRSTNVAQPLNNPTYTSLVMNTLPFDFVAYDNLFVRQSVVLKQIKVNVKFNGLVK